MNLAVTKTAKKFRLNARIGNKGFAVSERYKKHGFTALFYAI